MTTASLSFWLPGCLSKLSCNQNQRLGYSALIKAVHKADFPLYNSDIHLSFAGLISGGADRQESDEPQGSVSKENHKDHKYNLGRTGKYRYSSKKAFFKCRDCGQEFEAAIQNVVRSVGNGFTGCYDCKMRRKNAISKPECFVVRLMLAFAGENGIANPFSDVRSILGENSLLGLDFVDHIQKLCGEYNGVAWHGDDEHVVRDRFKFEAAHKAGYTMIRIQEPGLEVLDPKYDIVMPEGFCRNHKYDAKIMEEVGRKVIHLLEEIYGRKASPEIWALNNFKEFEVWYDTNKKELEANARKKGPKGKTAAKKAA